MNKKIAELRAELEAVAHPTGWQLVALGAIRTAQDNLRFHDEALAAKPSPPPVETPARK